MIYDFTTVMERRGKDALAVDAIGSSVKWAVVPTAPKNGFSLIPMWVADMNFATVPTIPQEIIKRAQHPAYGYYIPAAEYYNSIISWHKKRNGVTNLNRMLMYGKEASNRKQEIDRQHYTIPNQRPKDKHCGKI